MNGGDEEDVDGLINKKTLGILKTIKDMKDSSDNISKETQEALKAIEATGRLMDSLMSGKQVDLAYFKLFANSAIKRIKKAKQKKT